MGNLIALFAVFMDASGSTMEKVVLSIKGIKPMTYMSVAYMILLATDIVVFLVMGIALPKYLSPTGILFLIAVGLGLFTNLLYYRAVKGDDLTQVTQFSLLYNIPLIFLASIFFPEQSSALLIVLALVAAFTVIWSQWEGGFHIKKTTMTFFIWTLIGIPMISIIQTAIVEEWNPVALAISSDALIVLILLPTFIKSRKAGGLPKKAIPKIVISQILISLSFIIYLFGYANLGLLYTSLLIMLQPLLVYIFSVMFLKEKLIKKRVVAFIVVLLCIGVATIATS